MIVILFRMLLFISLAILVFTVIQYFRNPQTHLKMAKQSNEFYFLDEPNNRVKNIQFVYKGCLFEGEKYVGTTEDAFEVVDIHVIVKDPIELEGFTRNDLYFLEEQLLIRYPYATIQWKHPIDQLLLTKSE